MQPAKLTIRHNGAKLAECAIQPKGARLFLFFFFFFFAFGSEVRFGFVIVDSLWLFCFILGTHSQFVPHLPWYSLAVFDPFHDIICLIV